MENGAAGSNWTGRNGWAILADLDQPLERAIAGPAMVGQREKQPRGMQNTTLAGGLCEIQVLVGRTG